MPRTMDPALRATIARINKKHGSGTVVLGSQIPRPFIERITSGSLSLDVAIGGGWPVNHWTEIVGMESSGKTMLVLRTIAANQAIDPNWTVAWFAAEDFVDSYAEMWGCDLERIIVVQEQTMETVFESAKDFIDSGAVDAIVIDSLPALVPAREENATMEDFQPGLAAFLTGKFFRKVGSGLGRSVTEDERPVTGFIINQWRNKITQFGDPRTTPGGMAKNFFYFLRVEVVRAEWINNTKGHHIGQQVRITNVKNKQAPPGRQANIDTYFARGNGFEAGEWDEVKDTFDAAKAYGVIQQDGSASFTFGEYRWHGRPKAFAALRADPDLMDEIYDAVMEATTEMEDEEPPPPPKKAVAKKATAVKKRR